MIAELFIVASRPRSGTHLVSSTLDGLDDVTCHKEVFNPEQLSWDAQQRTIDNMWDQNFEPRTWITRQRLAASKDSRAFGLCIHNYQLEEMPDVKQSIKGLYPRVVLLRREDFLAQYVSREIARARRGWWSSKTDRRQQSLKTFNVPTQQFLQFCRETRASESKDRKLWKLRPVLEFTYESLVRDYERNMELLACFIGANHRPSGGFSAMTAKQEGRSMRDVVDNYNELAAACSSTKFHFLFTDRERLEEGMIEV